MKIETRFKIFDFCWFIDRHKVFTGMIDEIIIQVDQDDILVQYRILNGADKCVLREEYCFATKEELIESL